MRALGLQGAGALCALKPHPRTFPIPSSYPFTCLTEDGNDQFVIPEVMLPKYFLDSSPFSLSIYTHPEGPGVFLRVVKTYCIGNASRMKRWHLPTRTASTSRQHVSFSSSARRGSYEDTISNLRIGKHSRVIFQGFTGTHPTSPCFCLS